MFNTFMRLQQQPGLEGLGGLFKSKEQKLKELRVRVMGDVTAIYGEGCHSIKESIAGADHRMDHYVIQLNQLSEKIKNKTFDAKKFESLLCTEHTYSCDLLTAGLYHIPIVKKSVQKSLYVSDAYYGFVMDRELQEENPAYVDLGDEIHAVTSVMSKYALQEASITNTDTRTTLISAKYHADFLSRSISRGSDVIRDIKSVYSEAQEISEFYNKLKKDIEHTTDHKLLTSLPAALNTRIVYLKSAIYAVSSSWLVNSIHVCEYIANHCYG